MEEVSKQKQEVIFGVYDQSSKDAKAILKDGKCVEIKLLHHVPRGFYYSFLNDAHIAFKEQYPDKY